MLDELFKNIRKLINGYFNFLIYNNIIVSLKISDLRSNKHFLLL